MLQYWKGCHMYCAITTDLPNLPTKNKPSPSPSITPLIIFGIILDYNSMNFRIPLKNTCTLYITLRYFTIFLQLSIQKFICTICNIQYTCGSLYQGPPYLPLTLLRVTKKIFLLRGWGQGRTLYNIGSILFSFRYP